MDTTDDTKNIRKDGFKQNKSKNILNNLKSNYFLKILLDNLPKNKSFKIIKYNKKFQNRLNLSIKDYKEYSEHSPIELELIPIKNKLGIFINIPSKEEEFFHIYFDDRKEEINRNHLNEKDKIKTIQIKIDYQIISFQNLFKQCKCIETIFQFSIFNFQFSILDLRFRHAGKRLRRLLQRFDRVAGQHGKQIFGHLADAPAVVRFHHRQRHVHRLHGRRFGFHVLQQRVIKLRLPVDLRLVGKQRHHHLRHHVRHGALHQHRRVGILHRRADRRLCVGDLGVRDRVGHLRRQRAQKRRKLLRVAAVRFLYHIPFDQAAVLSAGVDRVHVERLYGVEKRICRFLRTRQTAAAAGQYTCQQQRGTKQSKHFFHIGSSFRYRSTDEYSTIGAKRQPKLDACPQPLDTARPF